MDIRSLMNISGAALTAERTRADTITANLANARATRTPDGGPYRRQVPVFEAVTASEDPFGDILADKFSKPVVSEIVEDDRPGTFVHDPGHPDADPDTGMVELPNVSVLEEMVDLMSSTRSYEANVTAISATKSMALKALEIGR